MPTSTPIETFSGSIMQPYFFPHPAYFQLLASSNVFCLHDQVKYVKQSWINRNRIIVNGVPKWVTLPLARDSDFRLISERELSTDFDPVVLLQLITNNYRKSPFFTNSIGVIEEILSYRERNLFLYLENSLKVLSRHFQLNPSFVRSSEVIKVSNYKNEELVIELCKALDVRRYVNSPGGVELYSESNFESKNVDLMFIWSDDLTYKNRENNFTKRLSVIDAMMYLEPTTLQKYIHSGFRLVKGSSLPIEKLDYLEQIKNNEPQRSGY